LKRRQFLKAGIGSMALTGILPAITSLATPEQAYAARKGGAADASANTALAPRAQILLDMGWKFQPMTTEATLTGAVAVTDWVWQPGTPDQATQMTDPALDTSGGNWKATTSGASTLAENSYGWFRTTLPALAGEGRVIHFECVDDNGDVYLNGKHLVHHEGYDDAFDVPLDTAWRTDGPNVLTVLVQNIGGEGGITKPVAIGKTAAKSNFMLSGFNDKSWRTVNLPHDYVVEGDVASTEDVGHGALPKFPAWYRRNLDIPASNKGKRLNLYFEGVYRNATVYVNGTQVYFQDDGYDPFIVDITDAVDYGGANVLTVHVNPMSNEGWWYEGAGIYRHVWLYVTDPVHVDMWGVYVTSDVQDVTGNPSATLTVQTTVKNESAADSTVHVTTHILDPSGAVVATAEGDQAVPAAQSADNTQTATLAVAKLWSLEERNMYKAVTVLTANGNVIDKHVQRFGVRTIRYDNDKGFFLNEKSVKLQGTCNHQDFAGVGIAMSDSILYWRMKRLQDKTGCNAIRCSHNPMAPAMYDACDDLGMLVMDETRHPGSAVAVKASVGTPYTDTWHIEKMVLRDRNNPSVIMWSLSNEEWAVQGDPYGAEMFAYLMDAVHKHDKTRPISSAANQGTGNGWLVGYGKVEDLYGVNYNYGDYDWLKQNAPAKPIFGSETASDTCCRGIYSEDKVNAHKSSLMSPEGSWEPLASRDFVCGGFAWTGFDYRGETSPYGWPEINSNFGLIDMCGFPKDMAYYYLAWWKKAVPMVHIFPHWNWPGQEGQKRPIWCFSNCESVELFVNGASQGAQDMPKFRHVQWNDVVYAPGKIEVRGSIGGQVVATKVVETTGAPAGITLTAQTAQMGANSEDIIPVDVAIVDAQGRVVPTASNMVNFSVKGVGVNAGVGNGDPSSHERSKADSRSAFCGLCMVLVQSTDRSGSITLVATSDGLAPAHLKLQTT